MCILSKYSNMFGKAGEGIHKARIFNTAAYDYFGSIVIAFIITYFSGFPLVMSTICVLVLGELCHVFFCVSTNTTRYFK